ncbi:tetraacyldisaccharide 4'-kinase [Bacteroidia bacterium]|nr:tetraacyldisaccharide 4'-kinase [Bacteroidia bacterium]
MRLLRIILFPVSLLYGLVTAARNKCYDWGWLPSVSVDGVKVVSVGNITVGGTGKTPHVEYLIRTLSQQYRIAVLSRGYKRKTKGFVLADAASTAQDVGDEPCQIKQKFPDLTVAVDADRVHGVQTLKERFPDLQMVLLDDAFQHRHIAPTYSILLADYHRPLYRDGMLPGGRMREWACFAQRADMLVISKTPNNVTAEEQQAIRSRYARIFSKKILFTTIKYGNPQPVFQHTPPLVGNIPSQSSILLITGIASPQPLENHIRTLSTNVQHLIFPDHHSYTQEDIRKITEKWQQLPVNINKYILTTEKDAVRLRTMPFPTEMQQALFYVPVEIVVV